MRADAGSARSPHARTGRTVAETLLMSHELHCYDYVNQPFETVRRAVLANPKALFAQATSTGKGAQLHVRFGAIELGAGIEVTVAGIEEKREDFAKPSTSIAIEWHGEHRAALFPVMTARLVLYPLTPTETQIELTGEYAPPLGVVGEAIDAVALRRFAQESVAAFVREIATYLRRSLAEAQASA
jgi:hypothetical protein